MPAAIGATRTSVKGGAMAEERVCVGAIAGAFGVRGEVRLKSFTAQPEDVATYGPLTTEDGSRRFDVTLTRPVKAGFVASLSGVSSKEAADALRGTRLYVARDRLPSLPSDEYYHSDLIGLDVFDTGGEKIGRIKAVHDHGAGDLLDIHGPGLKNGILLPFTQTSVPTVDIAAGKVVADPPEGLLPEREDG